MIVAVAVLAWLSGHRPTDWKPALICSLGSSGGFLFAFLGAWGVSAGRVWIAGGMGRQIVGRGGCC